jgi:hypothetical protein
MKNKPLKTPLVELLPIWLAFTLLSATACKPMRTPEGADTKLSTVDNFAAGKREKTQICGPQKPSNIAEMSTWVSGPNERLRFAAIQSIASVPDKLRGAIFGDRLKGRLKIVSAEEIGRQCGSNPSSYSFENESGSSLDFCWKKPAGGNLEMWVRADEKMVRHGILRLATFAYMQLIEENVANSNLPGDAGSEIIKAMNAARSKLAISFIADAARNPRFASRAASLQQARNSNPLDFDRKLFVEMIDSVYCNADSLNDFRTGFSGSFNEFVGKGQRDSINMTQIFGLPWHAR